MTITAKYPGRCRKCGGDINVGNSIEWRRGEKAYHTECPDAAPAPRAENSNDLIHISVGQGYGGHAYNVGDIIRRRDGSYVYAVRVSQSYYNEDGMSFGVGDEEGYIYSAHCRPATEEEAAPAIEAKKKAQDSKAAKARLDEIKRAIQGTENAPAGAENRPESEPRARRLLDTQNIYGGGDWFVVSDKSIWYVRNNGADGDDWGRNNVRTGGAGAIGWRVPYDAMLAAEIEQLAQVVEE